MVRRNSLGDMCESAPCTECCKLIKNFNIKNIVYSNSEGQLVKTRARDFTTDHISLGNRAIENKKLCPPF